MRKSKDGPKQTGKNLPKRSRKTTSESGTKSHPATSKRSEGESKHKEAPSELDQKVALELRPDRRKRDVPPVVVNGILSSVTIADTAASYPISVRQANALVEEIEHCWISNGVVTDLIMNLVKWLNQNEM